MKTKGILLENSEPLYLQLKKILLQEIRSGEFKEGSRLPPEAEISKTYELSLVTVRKTMAELVREGIIYRRPRRGTYVNKLHDKSLALKERNLHFISLGKEPPDLHYMPLLEGIEREGANQGYRTIYSSIRSWPGEKEKFYRVIDGGHSVFVAGKVDRKMTSHLAKKGVNFVVIGSYRDRHRHEDRLWITSDNRQGAYEAVEYLLGLGHRNIALINGPVSYIHYSEIAKGYREALKKNGVHTDSTFVFQDYAPEKGGGHKAAEKLLKLSPLPTAIVAGSGHLAHCAAGTLVQEGVRLPEDMSIIGIGEMHEDVPLPTTAMEIPEEELGQEAVKLLIHCLKTGIKSRKKVLSLRLIKRDSCRRL